MGQTRGASAGFFSFFKQIKTDASGQVSTVKNMGKFKAVIHCQTQEDKQAYRTRKETLIEELKNKLDNLARHKNGVDIDMGIEQFETLEARLKFEEKMKDLGVGHLNISQRLADLESDIILQRMLL
jgi:N12 class adenine-specific DNA methylase